MVFSNGLREKLNLALNQVQGNAPGSERDPGEEPEEM
jgi:hypothetical protein